MNEAMIAYHDKAHKLISDSLGLTPLDQINEDLYADDDLREYRVPVSVVRTGHATVHARDAKSAEDVVRVFTTLTDEIDDPRQTEYIGSAVAV